MYTRDVYYIRDENRASFEAAMVKLDRRAKRLSCEPISYSIGEPDDRLEKGGRVRRFWPVTVHGTAPKFASWTFLATLQHVTTDDGAHMNVMRVLPGASVAVPDMYRDAGPHCEHCNQLRRRKDTYLLVHDSGKMKQVGSTCIKDFLGHESPDDIASIAELLASALGAAEDGESETLGGSNPSYSVAHYLGFVAREMRLHGWMPRSKASDGIPATANLAYHGMIFRDKDEPPTQADINRGIAAIEWASTLHERDEVKDSDYLHNLNVVARCMRLSDRSTGIAASMIAAHDRALGTEREQALDKLQSSHVGTVGERIVLTLKILAIKELESNWGVSNLHRMIDEHGNRYTWFGSSQSIGKPGESVTIKATIKKHDEYKGVKQTVLGRCATHVEKVKAPRKSRIAKLAC